MTNNNYLFFKKQLIYTLLVTFIGIAIPLLSYGISHNFPTKFIEIYQNKWFILCNFISIILLNTKYQELYNNYNYRIRMTSNSAAYSKIIKECNIDIVIYWLMNSIFIFFLLIVFNYKIYNPSELIEVVYVLIYTLLLLIFTNVFFLVIKKFVKNNRYYLFFILTSIVLIITNGHLLYMNLHSSYPINYVIKYTFILIALFTTKQVLKKESRDI